MMQMNNMQPSSQQFLGQPQQFFEQNETLGDMNSNRNPPNQYQPYQYPPN